MNKETGFLTKLMSGFAVIAAVVTVAGVGYCTKVNHLEDRISQLEREKAGLAEELAAASSANQPNAVASSPGSGGSPAEDHTPGPTTPPGSADSEQFPKTNTDEASGAARAPDVAFVNGIRFVLLGCSRSDGVTQCNVSLTSIGRDIEDVYLTTRSFANVSGMDITAERVSFGATQNHRIQGRSDLAADVPKNASLQFEEIPSSKTSLALIELQVIVESQSFNVRFRDVPLE